MIRELRQTLKLKVCATKSAVIFQRMGCFDGQFVGENPGFLASFNLSILVLWKGFFLANHLKNMSRNL